MSYNIGVGMKKRVANSQKIDNALKAALNYYFEDEITYSDKDKFDTNLLQVILLGITRASYSHLKGIEKGLISSILSYPLFYDNKVKVLVQQGNTVEAFNRFLLIMDKRFSELHKKCIELYTKSMICLYEYFHFEKVADISSKNEEIVSKDVSLGRYILYYCFLLCIREYAIKNFISLTDEERESLKNKKSEMSSKDKLGMSTFMKMYPLKRDYIVLECDDSICEDFILIYNTVQKDWCSEILDGVEEDRNKKEKLQTLSLKNDWNILFSLMSKDFNYRDSDLEVKIFTDFSNINSKYSNIIMNSFSLYYDLFFSMAFNVLSKNYIVKKLEDEEVEKLDLVKQIQENKDSNKNLTKSVNRLNNENEKLKIEIEKSKVLITELEKIQQETKKSEEIESKIKELNAIISQLTDENQKLKNKSAWMEERIGSLEENLTYYDGIENELLVLQNKNNLLLSDIDKIEAIENSGEDEDEINKKLEVIKNEPIMFIGGVNDMFSKIIELFPNSDNINISDNNPNFTIPSRFKYVVVYTKVVKHCFCERAESIVGKENIIYLNILNKRLVIDELYKNISGHKN